MYLNLFCNHMRSLTAVVAIAVLAIFSGCSSVLHQRQKEKAIFSIDGEPVSTREFLYVYNKNNFNRDTVDLEKDLREYLDLYVNFKLKVREAKALGLDNTEAFINEFETYRDELAKPFLTENKVTEQLVEEAYQRLKEEIKASHILIKVDENADPEDTLKAWNKITAIRKEVLSGSDFAEMAKKHSEDPSAQSNSGSLGYFTALQMVYPFENQAFNTSIDSISEPFRTRFGYHILKVEDRRKSLGEVKVSHIMIRATDGISPQDSVLARNKIYEIKQKLSQGNDWNELCSQFSEDLSSKSNGGAIPWFSMGNMIPSFAETAFALNNEGEISDPVKSPYGWHLIRLEDRRGLESLEEMRSELQQKVEKDSRSELNQKMLLKRLKKENEFMSNQNLADLAFSYADSSLLKGKWDYQPNDPKLVHNLFTIGDQDYQLKDFYEYLKESQNASNNASPRQTMKIYYDQFVERSLLEYEKEHLADKYEDYRMLEQEYRDGILLFQLMDDKVWSRAVKDSIGLQKYYEDNLANYRWGERADAIVVNAANPGVIDAIKPYLEQNYFLLDENAVSLPFSENDLRLTDLDKSFQKVYDQLVNNEKLMLEIHYPNSEQEFRSMVEALFEESEKVLEDQIVFVEEDTESAFAFNLYSSNLKDLERTFNQTNPLDVKIEDGLFEQNELEILSETEWAPGKYEIEFNNRDFLVYIKEIKQPEYKKLQEIKGTVISDYQNYLEKEWVNELKNKYEVDINQNELHKIIKQFEKS